MPLAPKDLMLGLVYATFGLVYGVTTLGELPVGSPLNMGPGFFPLVLSGGLLLIGIAVAAKGFLRRPADGGMGTIAWRGLCCVSVATVVFALSVEGAGIVISTILAALIASLASRRARLLPSLLTAMVLAAFCTGVFVYGLNLPIGLLGSWFG